MRMIYLKAGAKYLGVLRRRGMDVEVRQDFEAIPDAARLAGREYQLPTFSIEQNDHTRSEVFWVFLKQGDNAIASVAAMRQGLADEPIDKYLKRVAKRQYRNSAEQVVQRVAEPLAQKVGGELAYIGELAVRQDKRGDRVALACFMRTVQILAFSEWAVGWSYAFLPARHVNANLDKVYGFTQRIPNAQTWAEPAPEKRSSSEWWVGCSRTEFEWFLKAEVELEDVL